MNRYILVDLENYCVSHLNKVDTDYDINEVQTSSVSCTNLQDTINTLKETIHDLETMLEREER